MMGNENDGTRTFVALRRSLIGIVLCVISMIAFMNIQTAGETTRPKWSSDNFGILATSTAQTVPNASTILVILNVFRRPYLQRQLEALARQTIRPKFTIIWQNDAFVNITSTVDSWNARHRNNSVPFTVQHIHSRTYNFKFIAKFVVPLLFDDIEYVAVLDDDQIPGNRFLEHAIRCVNEHGDAVCGSMGRKITRPWSNSYWTFHKEVRVHQQIDLPVDFVGHCWIFKRQLIHVLWGAKPFSIIEGDDIQMGAILALKAGVPTYLLSKPNETFAASVDEKLDYDGLQTSTGRHVVNANREWLRIQLMRHYLRQGWQVLCKQPQGANDKECAEFHKNKF